MHTIFILTDNLRFALQLRRELQRFKLSLHILLDPTRCDKPLQKSPKATLVVNMEKSFAHSQTVCRQLHKKFPLMAKAIVMGKYNSFQYIESGKCGADEYFSSDLAIEDVCNRLVKLASRPPVRPEREIVLSEYTINTEGGTVHYAGKPLHLRPREFEILKLLAENHGKVVSREKIEANLEGGRRTSIHAHICNVRKKLSSCAARNIIQTIHGVGYMIRVE